jgi:hypothetical protein
MHIPVGFGLTWIGVVIAIVLRDGPNSEKVPLMVAKNRPPRSPPRRFERAQLFPHRFGAGIGCRHGDPLGHEFVRVGPSESVTACGANSVGSHHVDEFLTMALRPATYIPYIPDAFAKLRREP